MNEENHHRIIELFAKESFINDSKMVNTLKEASNFTDSINAHFCYYLYSFYYDISVTSDTIQLTRANNDKINYINSMANSDTGELTIGSEGSDGNYYGRGGNKKEFYSIINDLSLSPKKNPLDIGNQSDNVAFLHAMASEDENEKNAKTKFEKHLTRCFSEFLFLEKEKDALFMLGIGFHGIMDSFTPSHTGFQKYNKQSMALHAQGDVIPFRKERKKRKGDYQPEMPFFDPGQYSKEGIAAKQLNHFLKGFDSDEDINNYEYEMLKIFLIISDIKSSKTGMRYCCDENGKFCESNINSFLDIFKGEKLSKVNSILKAFQYGEETAFVYSDRAIETLRLVYCLLNNAKKEIDNYDSYKSIIDKKVKFAIELWEKEYTIMHKQLQEKHALLYTLFSQKEDYTMHSENVIGFIGEIIDRLERGE